MPSPFPGMDPYLEQYWRDVHHALITYARDQLQSRLPGDLRARVEERVFVESEEGEARSLYPDVHVVEGRTSRGAGVRAEGDARAAQPLVIHFAEEPATQGFIQIIESGSGGRVVTVVECLSPSNKFPGEGHRLYREKQREVREAQTNLVEIDLTRAGSRVLAIPPERIPPSHRTTYQVCVWRAARPSAYEVYRVPLEEPLPTIRVPLRETDRDVLLDLQPLIDECYEKGRYDDLDYKVAPRPTLSPAEAAWAENLLRSKGLRT